MGFDLYGINPAEQEHKKPNLELYDQDQEAWHKQYENWMNQDGTYFRSNVWWWRQLANYVLYCCQDFIPEKDHEGWHSNGGHQVSEALAWKIADRVQKHIDSGDAKQVEDEIMDKVKKAKEHNKFIDKQMSDLLIKHNVEVARDLEPKHKEEWDEIYAKKDWADSYPFSVELLESFVKFCRESGGFEIC